jgi:hypothetical protein
MNDFQQTNQNPQIEIKFLNSIICGKGCLMFCGLGGIGLIRFLHTSRFGLL